MHEATRAAKNADTPTWEVLEETNLLFKSNTEIEAASHEEQMQAKNEFLKAFVELPTDADPLDYKAQYQRVKEIEQKEREITEATIAKYKAKLASFEQRRKEREAWYKTHAEWKKVSDAQFQEAKEYMESNFLFDENGEIIAYKTRKGVFRPVSELMRPKQDNEWDETSDETSDDIFAPTGTPIEASHSEQIPNMPQTPQIESTDSDMVSEVASFMADTFRRTFTEQVLDWNRNIEAQYADVLSVPHLIPEEFDEYYATKESRTRLQARQRQMQVEIADRVQRFLAEDTGNREEKLSIIRQTLSENWSPDIADGVLERLK